MLNWEKRGKVAQNILETIGFTPLVKLNRVSKEIDANILVKVEWFSPTGSHKDRIYYHMVMEAIRRGELRPGMEILESPTPLCGIKKELIIPEREHPLMIAGAGLNSRDILRPCAITEPEKQQARWEIIK